MNAHDHHEMTKFGTRLTINALIEQSQTGSARAGRPARERAIHAADGSIITTKRPFAGAWSAA